jgi:Flp pilus assembly protein TadD
VEAESGGSLKARMNLARVFARRGDAETASRWTEAATSLRPDIGDGLRAEVAALTSAADPSVAAAAIRRALERTPDDGALWNNLGYMLLRGGDGSAARDAFVRATTLVPLRGSSWLGLALAESGLRNPDGALAAADRAVAVDPTLVLARAIRADALLKLDRPCEALEAAAGVALETEQERELLRRVEETARTACNSPLSN